jgi:alkanesulfonate monooxygenase SsuD/methylene tetrahydromethanopterin reductase-like flavin-dependent oxidoreductase (luciferase family)
VQRPRIPVWIGGESRPALRRAARWDGWIVGGTSPEGTMTKTPEQLAQQIATIRRHRTNVAPFDVAMDGYSTPGDGAMTREYEAAGVTWWLESLHGFRGSVEEMIERAAAGPPQ